MPPSPLEENQSNVSNGLPPDGSISLSVLIDFVVQRTYHDLTVLAELLPGKSDVERKHEIYEFTNRTQQLFVRLLALVKWAKSISKIDESNQIMRFLDTQSLLFIDTANLLSRVARETVVSARLPFFHIPSAVEVLTTGTFSQVPTCIRERIIPPDKITLVEKRQTLLQLNRVIEHRLVCSKLISEMICKEVANGRVTFQVEDEFQVSLTLMGDSPSIPWRLLDIEILVKDKETGVPLVHPHQMQYIHQVVQARLLECCSTEDQSLMQVYKVLHYFCQSLQLELLFSQTRVLCNGRLEGLIHIMEYIAGKCLVVSYWSKLSCSVSEQFKYTLTIFLDHKEPNKPLGVLNFPFLGANDATITEISVNPNSLSMEKILMHTIYVRTKIRLYELRVELENLLKDVECTLQEFPVVLSVSILNPCLNAEKLFITVNTYTGMLQCHIPEFNAPSISILQQALNNERSKVPLIISDLRFSIIQRRCEKTLQHLPGTAFEKLSLLDDMNILSKISLRRMYIKLNKISNMIIILEFIENEKYPSRIEFKFYLANVKKWSYSSDESLELNIPKISLKILSLLTIEKIVATNGALTSFTEKDQENLDLNDCDIVTVCSDIPKKLFKHSTYLIPELAHIVALCDERLPFAILAQELTKRGISNQGVQIESNTSTFVLKILSLPPPSGIELTNPKWVLLCERILSISIRISSKGMTRCWSTEYVFYGSPLLSTHCHEQGARRPVYNKFYVSDVENMSKTVDTILNDWAQIVHLYFLVEDLSFYLQSVKDYWTTKISIKSYNYLKIIIQYDIRKLLTATIQWNSTHNQFNLVFGSSNCSINPHNLIKEQLESYLKSYKKISLLIHELLNTLNPLSAICKLPSIPQLCVLQERPQEPIITFGVVAYSTNLIKVIYEGQYCLEILLRWGNLVSIRDGAYSSFDRTSVISKYTPIPELKEFLFKYLDDKNVFRRQSQSEQDNPLITTDNIENNFLSGISHEGLQFPAQASQFHSASNTTSGNNPHILTSTHPAVNVTNIAQNPQQQFNNIPVTYFNLSSPLSPQLATNSSQSMLPSPLPGFSSLASSPNPLHVPSPARLLPNSLSSSGSGFGLGSSAYPPEVNPFQWQSMTSPATSNLSSSPNLPNLSPGRAQRQTPAEHSLQSPDHKIRYGHTSMALAHNSSGAVPIFITHEALNILCTPTAHSQDFPVIERCPLERFLGCIYMRRSLQKIVEIEENIVVLSSSEMSVVNFKVETFECLAFINMHDFQSLNLKITCIPEQKDPWNAEDLNILEIFFETKVAILPCKPYTLLGFIKMLKCPYKVLKDFIQIIKLEMIPGLIQKQQFKWTVQWCLRIPPFSTSVLPVGKEGILILEEKIVFFLQFTRIGVMHNCEEVPSLVLPIIYNAHRNVTQLVEKRGVARSSTMSAVSSHFKRFAVYFVNRRECSIFPAVQDLMLKLVLPSEPQPNMSPAKESMNVHPPMNPEGPVGPNCNTAGQNINMKEQNSNMVGLGCNNYGDLPMSVMGSQNDMMSHHH